MAVAFRGFGPNVLATVAHELRMPISALEIATELLERDLERMDGVQLRQMVAAIHGRAFWMRTLVENLLSTAAAGAGRFSICPRPLDLAEVVHEVALTLRPLLKRKGQRLRVRIAKTCPLVSADEHRLSQVLLNLVSNAHKYSAPDTTIEVTLGAHAGAVRVRVLDRGSGLPDGPVARLFYPFERAGRHGADGLGIGLAVVDQIVRAHGGRAGATNRRGGGAEFWFEIPQMVGRAAAKQADSEGKRAG